MSSDDDFLGPVNIGNPNEFSILSLAEKVVSKTNSKSKIVFKRLPKDDPRQRQPDISLAKSQLGWEPRTNLDDGLSLTIDYFKNIIG